MKKADAIKKIEELIEEFAQGTDAEHKLALEEMQDRAQVALDALAEDEDEDDEDEEEDDEEEEEDEELEE
jgi:hypothetical protein